MTAKTKHPLFQTIDRMAEFSATPTGLAVAFVGIAFWAGAGMLLHFPEGWRLTIDTLANIATLVVVFLIQSTQRSARRSLEAKLDRLIEKALDRPLTSKDIQKIVNENIVQACTAETGLFRNALNFARLHPAVFMRAGAGRGLRQTVH